MIPYFGTTGWQIGFLKIQSWGLLVALGFLVGLFISWRLIKRQKLNQDIFLNLFVWLIIGSLVGGRFFYVFFENFSFFRQAPWDVFKIWQGGLSSFGGFFGAALTLYFFWRRKKNNWQYLDILALAFPFGWAIGRIGCLLIHDHPGILSNTFLAIKFAEGPRLDMALLEILMLTPLMLIFALKGLKMLVRPALLSFWLFLWYGIGRFLLDFLRAGDINYPDARYGGMTVAQWGCLILIICALSIFKKRWGRIVV